MDTTTNNLTLTEVNAPTDQGCACGGCGCGEASASAESADAVTATATATDAAGVTQTFGVTGMTCAHCVSSVTEELSEIAGVGSVTVDLNVGGASTVTVLSDSALSTDVVRAAVEDAGYALVTPTA